MRVRLLKDLTLSLSKGVEVDLSEVQYLQVSNLVELLKDTEKTETETVKNIPKGIKTVSKKAIK